MPLGTEVLHDEQSGDVPVVWVVEECLTADEAEQLEVRINEAALAKGRRLSTDEILRMIPVAV